jgi:hypothetical protein
MPTPERFLALLQEQIFKHALEALNPGVKDQSEFGYGKACGILHGLRHAEALWNDQTAQEERASGEVTRGAKR